MVDGEREDKRRSAGGGGKKHGHAKNGGLFRILALRGT